MRSAALLSAVLLSVLIAVLVYAAGTVTETASTLGSISRHNFAWTADTNGDATASSEWLNGEILRVVFEPGSPGPLNAYDVTLTDANSFDVLAGQGANIASNATVSTCPGVALDDGTTTSVREMTVDGSLDLVVDNAGSEAQGTIVLYLRR